MAVQLILQRAGGGTINLYNKNADTPSTVIRAGQKQSLLGEDVVNVTVESAVRIPFSIGDKTTIFGRDYKINRLPKPKKTGNRLFTYDIELEGVQYDLMRATYDLNIDTTNNGLQDVQADTLTGNLHRFATVLIANANRVFPGKWTLGEYPADTGDKTLTFGETDNCLSVLQQLCSEYNTEFDIEQVGGVNTINFGKAGQIFPYTFEYGKGKGLYELERQNVSSANIVTRLKVFGGTRNISYKYRAARLCLPGKTKGQSYIEKASAVTKYGIWEATKHFDNIYPSRTGTITGLVEGSVLKFVDNTMNFDLSEKEADGVTTKYLLDGVAAKIHFNSGNLSGFEFELQAYDHATKTFTLKPFKDERDETYPSEKSEAFQFAAGDKYVILDIALPQTYIDEAEVRLAAEGDTYYNQNSQPKVQYSLAVAEEFLKSLSEVGGTTNIFQVGDYLPVRDADIDVDKSVRIQGFTRDLIDEYKYQLTISDTVTTNITNRVISELIDLDKVVKINNLKDPARARRDWRSAQELLDMIFDVEGDYYSEKIKPGSIETQMLSVGAKSTQFGLIGTVIQANYNGNKNSVNVKGGVLTHYTIEEDGRIWNLADNTTTLTGDSTPYYIYAKCQKVGTAGSIIFSTEQIKVEQDPDYYHFFIGVVNSVDPGLNVRSVALTYGFTTVNGRFVRTGRIQSNDGSTYFDLDAGEIGGIITFRSSGGSNTDLGGWADDISGDIQDTQQAANNADAKAQQALNEAANIVSGFNAEIATLQQQIDGEVSNWFYPYSPALNNYPASDWTTNAIKDRHIGDTFTNTQPSPAADAGKSWRFVKNGSVYSWTQIADSDAVLALQKAAQAQATADGKSTTFLVQPSNYHLGDTWVLNADRTINGTAYRQGEILTATQDSTTFVEAHWIKRVRYTDDTAVDNLQIGGVNLLDGTSDGWVTVNATTAQYYTDNFFPGTELIEGQQYTFSWEAELLSGSPDIYVHMGCGSTGYQRDIESGILPSLLAFSNKSTTFTPANLSGGYTKFAFRWYNNRKASSFRFRKLKLETGAKATDWDLSRKDMKDAIDAAQTYEEYSVNGASGWHYPFATGDIFMRRKIGLNGTWGDAVRIVGEKGATGADGKYTDFQFSKNTSATTPPTSGWQDAPPSLSAGEYLWMREGVVTPPATTPPSWSAVRLSGEQGIQGIPGQKGADGITYYTWVRYADTPTSGISQYPAGKKYIGFAYNKTTAAESNTYSDYAWSLIQGEQGQPGANGADGVQYYNWIKYADTPTSGMSDNPAGKAYMGIAVNKTTATESTNYADYTWQLTKGDKGDKGDDGVSIANVDVEFAVNTSTTTAPTTGWATNAPALTGTQQLWTRTKTAYSSGNPTYSTPANITPKTGAAGAPGATGTGIESVTEEYAISTSKTIQPTTGWGTTQPAWVQGQYIWSRVKVVYKNPTSTIYTGYAVSSEWEAVNNLQIGGVNLVVSSRISAYAPYNSKPTITNDTLSTTRVNGQPILTISYGIVIPKGKRYTVSGFMKQNGNPVTEAMILSGTKCASIYEPAPHRFLWDDATGRFEITQTWNNQNWIFHVSIENPNNSAVITIDKFKFEEGDKATGWSESPEDVQARIDSAKQDAASAAAAAAEAAGIADGKGDVLIQSTTPAVAMRKSTTLWIDTTGGNNTPKRWGGSAWVAVTDKTAVDAANAAVAAQNAANEAQNAANNAQLTAEQAQLAADGYMRARYVRDWCAGSSANAYPYWVEVKAILKNGTNIAINKPVTSDKAFANLQRVTDGDTDSENHVGTTAINTLSYVQVDLGAVNYDIDYIQVWHYWADGRTFSGTKTEISVDGTNWTPVFDSAVSGTYQETKQGKVHSYRPADVLAKLNKSYAVADKFKTTINGGLVSAVMMVLRGLDSAYETAGISGIQGALRDNPALWAGGGYAQAFALIQFLSKMSAGTTPGANEYANLAKITMLHNGAAKVGDFIIEESGRIVMIDPATGKPRLMFAVQDLPLIADLTSNTVFNGSANIGGGSTSTSQVLSGSTNVTKNGANATFGGTTISIHGWGSGGAIHETGSATANLFACRNGIPVIPLASATIYFDGQQGQYVEESVTFPQTGYLNLLSGYYTFELVVNTFGHVASASASCTGSTFSWQFLQQGVRYQQYGLDGMMLYYSNHHFHFTEGGGMDGRAAAGKWNTPGVLLSATVSINGGFLDWWGAKKHATQTAVKNSAGRYTVYHSIGHENYQVTATALTANKSCHVVSKGASTFVIEWRSVLGTQALSDTAFDFQITGNNYN